MADLQLESCSHCCHAEGLPAGETKHLWWWSPLPPDSSPGFIGAQNGHINRKCVNLGFGISFGFSVILANDY